MAYEKNIWRPRQATGKNRFLKSKETPTEVYLDNEPLSITDPGTPFAADRMNHIEDGIEEAHDAIAAESQIRQQGDDELTQAISAETLVRQEADIETLEKLAEAMQEHDEDGGAHPDIMAAVSAEAQAREQTDLYLQEQIALLSPDGENISEQLAALAAQVLGLTDRLYPVGAIYLATVNRNPAEFIGGTWTVWGQGRVPVGVDTTQAEFNTAEKAGGAKTHTLSVNEMPSHNHLQYAHNHLEQFAFRNTTGLTAISNDYGVNVAADHLVTSNTSNIGVTHRSSFGNGSYLYTQSATPPINNTGGGSAHNNLQPYITCYMWKRTA